MQTCILNLRHWLDDIEPHWKKFNSTEWKEVVLGEPGRYCRMNKKWKSTASVNSLSPSHEDCKSLGGGGVVENWSSAAFPYLPLSNEGLFKYSLIYSKNRLKHPAEQNTKFGSWITSMIERFPLAGGPSPEEHVLAFSHLEIPWELFILNHCSSNVLVTVILITLFFGWKGTLFQDMHKLIKIHPRTCQPMMPC